MFGEVFLNEMCAFAQFRLGCLTLTFAFVCSRCRPAGEVADWPVDDDTQTVHAQLDGPG